jgi:hypothetical protein
VIVGRWKDRDKQRVKMENIKESDMKGRER